MTDVTPAVEAPSSEKPSSPFSRMVGVLFSPTQTFADIARKPDWVVPAIVIILVALAAAIVTVPRIDFESQFREAFEAKGMSGPQVEQATKFTVAITKGTQYLSPLLIIGFLAVVALLYWVGTKMVGGAATYQQVFSVALYAWMPLVIKLLARIPIVLTKHNISPQEVETVVRSSPAFLTSFKANPMLWALFQRLDLFLIWSLILAVIGLAAAARLSKAKTAAVVFVVWCLGTLFAVGGGAMAKMRAK
jgi:hypothetical protein